MAHYSFLVFYFFQKLSFAWNVHRVDLKEHAWTRHLVNIFADVRLDLHLTAQRASTLTNALHHPIHALLATASIPSVLMSVAVQWATLSSTPVAWTSMNVPSAIHALPANAITPMAVTSVFVLLVTHVKNRVSVSTLTNASERTLVEMGKAFVLIL